MEEGGGRGGGKRLRIEVEAPLFSLLPLLSSPHLSSPLLSSPLLPSFSSKKKYKYILKYFPFLFPSLLLLSLLERDHDNYFSDRPLVFPSPLRAPKSNIITNIYKKERKEKGGGEEEKEGEGEGEGEGGERNGAEGEEAKERDLRIPPRSPSPPPPFTLISWHYI